MKVGDLFIIGGTVLIAGSISYYNPKSVNYKSELDPSSSNYGNLVNSKTS